MNGNGLPMVGLNNLCFVKNVLEKKEGGKKIMTKPMTFKRYEKDDCVVLFDDIDAVIMNKEDYPAFDRFIEEETDWKEDISWWEGTQ